MKKISLKNNANALSRNEMRNIAGGDFWNPGFGTTPSCGEECGTGAPGVDCSKNTSCSRCKKTPTSGDMTVCAA